MDLAKMDLAKSDGPIRAAPLWIRASPETVHQIFQTREVQAAHRVGHLGLDEVRGFRESIVRGGADEILEKFKIIGDRGFDLDGGDVLSAIDFDADHAAAGGAFDSLIGESFLNGLHF